MNLYYAVKNKDDLIRQQSASGGFFSIIAEYVLDKNGYVYGATLSCGKVKHIRIDNVKDLELLRGSKYVQSDLKDILRQVQLDIRNETLVLFSGTPCQCAAVRSMIGNADNLILMDIVCHGVSSPKVFEEYWKMLEKNNGKIKKFNFRDKEYSWMQQQWSVEYIDNKKDATSYEMKSYKELYYKTILHRESCFECPFTSTERKTDFTIGDFWGIEKFNKEIIDDNGVSLVIVHSDHAKEIWEQVSDNIFCWKAEEKDCLQPQLCHPTRQLYKDTNFWDDFCSRNSYEKVMKKYGWPSLSRRLKDKIKKIIK